MLQNIAPDAVVSSFSITDTNTQTCVHSLQSAGRRNGRKKATTASGHGGLMSAPGDSGKQQNQRQLPMC